MRAWIFVSILGSMIAVHQCGLTRRIFGKEYPTAKVEDAPKVPVYTETDLEFHAEVSYSTIHEDGTENNCDYSTLYFAFDFSSLHLAYHNTPWNQTKVKVEPDEKPEIDVIYDGINGYVYDNPHDADKCEIYRNKNFAAELELPNGVESIGITDPSSILFPNTDTHYAKEDTIRGLKVNVFEAVVLDYHIKSKDSYVIIPTAFMSYAYSQDNSLVQVQMGFAGRKNVVERIIFDVYGFATELRNRSSIFNIQSCFQNGENVRATIGFNAGKDTIQKVIEDVPNLQDAIVNAITMHPQLNFVRTPVIEVDVKDLIFVSLLILEKPPVILDYMNPEQDQTVLETTQSDVENFDSCATRCLETENSCWGFSMCGAVCHFGTPAATKVGTKKGCQLYRRFDMDNFIPSLEHVIRNIRKQIEQKDFSLILKGKNDNMVQIDATSFQFEYTGYARSI